VSVGSDGGEVGAVEDGALEGTGFEEDFVGADTLVQFC
jgi:hypothetical protein